MVLTNINTRVTIIYPNLVYWYIIIVSKEHVIIIKSGHCIKRACYLPLLYYIKLTACPKISNDLNFLACRKGSLLLGMTQDIFSTLLELH